MWERRLRKCLKVELGGVGFGWYNGGRFAPVGEPKIG